MKNIILFLAVFGFSALYASFIKDGDIITDSSTGLIWEDNSSVETTTYTWSDAIDYCENLELGSYTDWRLPNINELLSIVDYTENSPALDSTFKFGLSDDYWTSTTYNDNTSGAWRVDFTKGLDYFSLKTNSNYVRCVR